MNSDAFFRPSSDPHQEGEDVARVRVADLIGFTDGLLLGRLEPFEPLVVHLSCPDRVCRSAWARVRTQYWTGWLLTVMEVDAGVVKDVTHRHSSTPLVGWTGTTTSIFSPAIERRSLSVSSVHAFEFLPSCGFGDGDDAVCCGSNVRRGSTGSPLVQPPSTTTSAHRAIGMRRMRRIYRVAPGPQRARPTYFVSRYSSMPSVPPSRPKPDALTPPNGAAGFDTMPWLMPTMPVSRPS